MITYTATGDRSINDLRNRNGYNWCSELPLSTPVHCYSAVVSRNELLVNVNDYIAFEPVMEGEEKVRLTSDV